MKILVVDDRPRRYDRLVAALAGIGVQRSDIDIVGCANAARERLGLQSYDLLILDILLPLWPETDESPQHSADLLFEISEGEVAHPPRHILGITADQEVTAAVAQQFEDSTWTVLHYADDNDEWVKRATNCAKYLLEHGS